MRKLVFIVLALFTGYLHAQRPICGAQDVTKYVNYTLELENYRNLELSGIRYFDSGYWVSGSIESMATGNRDFIVIRLNDTGGVVFTKILEYAAQESGYCSALPVSGGCLIAGRSKGIKDVAIISKVSNSGVLEWSRTTPSSTGSYDAFRGVHMDESKGQILAVGTGMQKTASANVLIASLDKNGNTKWTRNLDLGGSQHHLNAIRKLDSIYIIAGWAMYNGTWKPTVIQVSETGRLIFGQYTNTTENGIYVDMDVSPTGKIYLLGFSIASGRQYAFLTCMDRSGTVSWRRRLGFGYSDFGDNLFYNEGRLWVFAQSLASGSGKREFFVQYDTLGNVVSKGGLFESPYTFSAKINGWPVSRSHYSGIAALGVDNKNSGTVHFEIIYTNPCDKIACSVNPLSGFVSNDVNIDEKSVIFPNGNPVNGDLTALSMSNSAVSTKWTTSCLKNCYFYNVKKLPVSAEICIERSDSILLDVSNADCTYQWNDGDTSSKKSIKNAGMFWVKTANACGTRLDTIYVTGLNMPSFSRISDTLFCGKVWIHNIVIGMKPKEQLQWENGDLNGNRSISSPGIYGYTLSNRCGVWRDTFVISEDSAPKSVLPKLMTLCIGNNALIDGTQPGKGVFKYLWEDGYTGPSMWVTSPKLKVLKTSNRCGTVVDSVRVVFTPCNDCYFYVPNAFTPRSSRGKNDGWKPVYDCDMDNVTFNIYSRWGECLVRNQPISIPWDGTYMGELVSDGMYVYIITGSYTDPKKGGKTVNRSGTLLVLDGGK
jgi:gliding motility-associated-like protein